MATDASDAKLEQIRVDSISRNAENPRLVFRPNEFEDLVESIRLRGVQVPISVYKEGRGYVLIDGERRWRCSLKLNHKTIPALVQSKPSPLENLLLMFNIHSLREQWDLLTIALKLPQVVKLLTETFKRPPIEREISEQTGLNRSVIRRCKLLMELPQKYKNQILAELNKPKSQQKLTEDFFIEMERALKTVERSMPSVMPDKDAARKILIKKFKAGVIDSRIHFRNIGKIARAESVKCDPQQASQELEKLFADNKYSIEEAFLNSVGEAYAERDVGMRVTTLLNLLDHVEADELDADVKIKLQELRRRLTQILAD